MKMKKMTSEKKHKIATIGLWLILILCTAVLFSLCLSEGIDYDEAYSYRTAHDNTMMGIIRVVRMCRYGIWDCGCGRFWQETALLPTKCLHCWERYCPCCWGLS